MHELQKSPNIMVAPRAGDESDESVQEESLSIGEILLASGRLTVAEVQKIADEQKRFNLHFGQAALKLNLLDLADLESALSRQFGYAYLKAGEGVINSELITAYQPFSKVAEQMRSLRVRLILQQVSQRRGARSVALVSAQAGEGRSFIAANLAVVFSQLGEKTLLIDADMRNPSQHKLFGLDNRLGLSNVLLGRAGLDCAVAIDQLSSLSILPAGSRAPNPQELLARPALTRLLTQAAESFDVVIIDTSPVADYADAQLVAARVGASVLISRAGQSNSMLSRQAMNSLRESGATVIGAVLNDA
jgi:receptor protein-tyrosine kinase